MSNLKRLPVAAFVAFLLATTTVLAQSYNMWSSASATHVHCDGSLVGDGSGTFYPIITLDLYAPNGARIAHDYVFDVDNDVEASVSAAIVGSGTYKCEGRFQAEGSDFETQYIIVP